ncbi:MAG: STAS domain-containing protein [Enterobacteriaceae bacterium]
MHFETQIFHNVHVITPLVRRLDASVSTKFKQETLLRIETGSFDLLLNFCRVDFVDSSCLGALVSLLKAMQDERELALCALNDNIRGMFQLTRMDRIFTIYPDQSSALQRMCSCTS